MVRMTQFLMRIEPELLARIDELRGEVPRVTWIRNRLAETVGLRQSRADQPRTLPLTEGKVRKGGLNSPESLVFERPPAPRPIKVQGGYTGPSAPSGPPPTGGSSVQFGPTKRVGNFKPDKGSKK